ncbi:hypothetical protein DPMN_100469 [Dreissena polymorpha]|uniref:Uncharacterized protein n=1 Tax=Dreissena polymorpha TaxID=45954 RepID=A0A9D4LHD8_DREPO|nr:hypothetical protein DPMN_100469 [Dreissena polymorpha]
MPLFWTKRGASESDFNKNVDLTHESEDIKSQCKRLGRSDNFATTFEIYKVNAKAIDSYGGVARAPHDRPEDARDAESKLCKRHLSTKTCGQTNIYHNTSSLTYMIDSLNLPTLETRRNKFRLIKLYKNYPPHTHIISLFLSTTDPDSATAAVEVFKTRTPLWPSKKKKKNGNLMEKDMRGLPQSNWHFPEPVRDGTRAEES